MVIAVAALIVAAFFVLRFALRPTVPETFLQARSRGAAISKEIVASHEHSLENLRLIAENDRKKEYFEGIKLVLQELNVNAEMRTKAQELAGVLETMAGIVPSLRPTDARQRAFEAVTAEVDLITHLISYNEDFNKLLEKLRLKLEGEFKKDEVRELIKQINGEAETINQLNERFNVLMNEFDSYYK
ncbi:MAG: hypothetical protein HY456_03100 [Parcubacteria group bacterium]|nr:hypothetical protein [Parcubacteria group bacterium]